VQAACARCNACVCAARSFPSCLRLPSRSLAPRLHSLSLSLSLHPSRLPSPCRSDIIPELLDGKNIADYVDPEIEARLAELEAEEDALLAADGALRVLCVPLCAVPAR